jgi:predicted esterase
VRFLRALAIVPCAITALIAWSLCFVFLPCMAWWLATYTGSVGLLSIGAIIAIRRRRLPLLVIGVVLFGLTLGGRFVWTRGSHESPVTSWRAGVGRHVGGSLLPERDWMIVAARLLPTFWNWPPSAVDDSSFGDTVQRQYDALDTDAATRGLESVVPAQVLGSRKVAGHYFLVLPSRPSPPGGFPALLFLHGFGGNYQVYASWLRQLADERGLAAILPTGSFKGTWWQPDEQAVAMRALSDVADRHVIDPQRVIVGGLSNGGVGACELAAVPGRFQGLLAIAAFPPIEEAKRGIGNEPAVFVGALHDDRFPIDELRASVDAYRASGTPVGSIEVDGDHLAIVRAPGILVDGVDQLCRLGAKVCAAETAH